MGQTSSSTAGSPSTTSDRPFGRRTGDRARPARHREEPCQWTTTSRATSRDDAIAAIADEAAALAEAHVEDDQDKAPAAVGAPVDPGGRRVAIGVDVGGSGIKAAAVDLDTGELIGLRHRVPTPQPSTPAAVVASIARMVKKIVVRGQARRPTCRWAWAFRPSSSTA